MQARTGSLWLLYVTLAYSTPLLAAAAASAAGLGVPLLPLQRASFLAALSVGVLLLFVPHYILQGGLRWSRRTLLGASVATLSVFGAMAIGVFERNPAPYVVSDTLYFLIAIGGFLVTRLCGVRLQASGAGLRTLVVITSGSLAASHFAAALTGVAFQPSILAFHVAGLTAALFQAQLGTAAIGGAAIALTLGSFNRAALLAVVATMAAGAWLARRRIGVRKLLGIAVVASVVAAAGIVVIVRTGALRGTGLLGRIVQTQELLSGERRIEDQIAIWQRLYEARQVLHSVADSPWHWATGFGSGAVVDMSDAPTMRVGSVALLGARSVHNIHLLPMAVLYRHGLIGILLLASLAVLVWRMASRLGSWDVVMPVLACVAVVLYAMPASSFFFSEPATWLGIGLAVNAAEEAGSMQRRDAEDSPIVPDT